MGTTNRLAFPGLDRLATGLSELCVVPCVTRRPGAESLWTVVGVGLLAMGHDCNRRAKC